uniref:hypothetical protein n=1 Tax=Megamonas hypermegale TaxID=158847 RepID=UPI0026E96F83
MANWSTLKAAIANIIKTNGNKEITGQLLQNALNNIVSSVGENSTFAGIAIPATNPGVPDGNVFYLATEAGIYSNFNGIEITDGEAVILEWRGSWLKKTSGFSTQKKFNELSLRNNFFSDIPTEGNLIDPNKIIKGYYFGEGGMLTQNVSYGYIYIPMRGNNITINYSGGFKLSACNKYGSVTHTNTETAQTVGGRTIQYQEGDEYAMISVPLDILDKTASAEYGDE